jgi:hypothetical protein
MPHCSIIRLHVEIDGMFSEKLLHYSGQIHKYGQVHLTEWSAKSWSSSESCIILFRADHLISITTDSNSCSYCLHANSIPTISALPYQSNLLCHNVPSFPAWLLHYSYIYPIYYSVLIWYLKSWDKHVVSKKGN